MKLLLATLVVAFFVSLSSPAVAAADTSGLVLQSQNDTPSAPSQSAATQTEAPNERRVTEYTLPPDLHKKAHFLSRLGFWGQLVGFVYSVVVLLLILRWNWAARFRDWAESITKNRFAQACIFAPPILLAIAVLSIPFDIAQEWVSRKFGLSVQSWPSWLWDWTKGQLLSFILGAILIWILYAVIRRSPRRWWFYFWLVSLPITVLLVFLQPVVVDPLFHKFEPLQSKDPVLTASLERMVQHAGQEIPPERMFWMDAAEKTTELNAYVTGLGASKRIVVWNTTIAKMNAPQIVFVAGHEMGHYVLNHVWKGLAFAAVFLFVIFWLGAQTIGGVLARSGAKWGIRGLDDWASFPALMFLLTIFSFVASPIFNAYSRHVEHQADQYGLEVTHGLTPDSSQIAAQAFQVLGEVDLSDPDPIPLDVLLFYSHPAISDRVRFALSYDPWAHGGTGEFVK
ncbi:MAG: M48 family metallopeptidase [Candidatus Acidiferrales bacterium]|jgi:STE24 endopeptidase